MTILPSTRLLLEKESEIFMVEIRGACNFHGSSLELVNLALAFAIMQNDVSMKITYLLLIGPFTRNGNATKI